MDQARRNMPLKNKSGRGRIYQRGVRALTKYWQLYVMLILPIIFIFIFCYMTYPGLRIAFMNYKPAKGWNSDWVGFETFRKIFADHDFWRALRNTVVFNVIELFAGFPVPIILALLINELRLKGFKRVSQTILYLPHFLSSVIVASIAYTLFKPETGLVNVIMMNLGIIETGIPFLTEKYHWAVTYILINIWQGMGWGSIVYLSAMSAINSELYEAATVDGANRFQRLWHITLPGIKPTVVMLLIMRLGSMLGSGFERLNAFGNVNVKEFQYQLSVYIYEKGIRGGAFSQSTAVGLFSTLVGLILVLTADRIAKKLGEDGLI